MKNRLQEQYETKVVPQLMEELGITNIMQVPRIKKININARIGSFKDNREAYESFFEELTALAGQRPYHAKAKKSEAGFKIRQGETVAFAVTLRNVKMWAFLDKLISVVLPRVRDFSGLSLKAFDEGGNYSLGIKEHTIFPEVNPNTVKANRGLQVTIVTNTSDKEENIALLKALGLPFEKEVVKEKESK